MTRSDNTDPPVPEDLSEFTHSLGRSVKQYVDSERRHIELVVSDRVGRAVGKLVVAVLLLLVVNWMVLLAVLAGAKAWSAHLHDEVMGYLAMTATVLGFGICLLLLAPIIRRWVKLHLINTLHGHD